MMTNIQALANNIRDHLTTLRGMLEKNPTYGAVVHFSYIGAAEGSDYRRPGVFLPYSVKRIPSTLDEFLKWRIDGEYLYFIDQDSHKIRVHLTKIEQIDLVRPEETVWSRKMK